MGDFTQGVMDPVTLGMMYGAQHQAQMQQQTFRYQSQFSTFDANGPTAQNPLMSAFSSMGPSGAMMGMIAQTALMSFAPGIMQRFAMPPGTDYAAAARTRAYQMYVGGSAMGNMGAVWRKEFPGVPEGILSMLPMADVMLGGAITKATTLLDPNFISMQGTSAIAQAAQWQDTMNVLDTERASMLQDSLTRRSRYRPLKAGKDYNLRDINFTAGFSNDDLAQMTLYAERQGLVDTDEVAKLRSDPNVRGKATEQLRRLNKIGADKTATDAQLDTYIRNEAATAATGNVAQVARRLQQGLLQNATAPELLGFMEANSMDPRNGDSVTRINAVIERLEALGRAAGMSGDVMMKHAAVLQQQFGGSVMAQANNLAMGQGIERMLLMEGGSGGTTGFRADRNVSQIYTGRLVESQARVQGSQFMARLGLLELTHDPRLEQYFKLAKEDPAAAAEFLETGLGREFNARARRMGRDMINAGRLRLEQDSRFNQDQQDSVEDAAVVTANRRALRTKVLLGGVSGRAFDAGLQAMLSDDKLAAIMERNLLGNASEAERATLAAAVRQNLGGMDLSKFEAVTMDDKNPEASALITQSAGRRARVKTAAERERYILVNQVTNALQKLSPTPEGVNVLVGMLQDPDEDIIGKFVGKAGTMAGGVTDMLVAAGILTKEDSGKAMEELKKLNDVELRKKADAVLRMTRAQKKFQAGGTDEEQEKNKAELLAATAEVTAETGRSVDTSKVLTRKEIAAAAPMNALTDAMKKLTSVYETGAKLLNPVLEGLDKLIREKTDGKEDKPKKDAVPEKEKKVAIHITLEKGLTAVVDNAGSSPGLEVDVGNSTNGRAS